MPTLKVCPRCQGKVLKRKGKIGFNFEVCSCKTGFINPDKITPDKAQELINEYQAEIRRNNDNKQD